jgi:CheY-like chemotaxis protein
MDGTSATSLQPGRGYRALVVDDEAPLAEVVASYLEREQFETTIAASGSEAIAVARELDPDVVILDLGLPGWTDWRCVGCGSTWLQGKCSSATSRSC